VITGGKPLARRKPMVWVFPEYGGQAAVRVGDFKIIRQGLATKSPGAWEVYDLRTDHGEEHDLARNRGALISQCEEILNREVADNAVFPLAIPGVNATK
jgi:hypothetical protein